MRNILSKAISFVKENPSIIYSLILAVLVPGAFFINTYLINSSYEANIDKITQRKAVLVENIINKLILSQNRDDGQIQEAVDKITQEKNEVISLSVIKPVEGNNGFQVIASSDPTLINEREDDSVQNLIAWNKPEGVAFLNRNEQGRFWNVTKMLSDDSGKKVGLISLDFSLEDSDALIARTIANSYWILIITVLIVVLLVSNQARLFGYALAVTKLKEIDKMKDMFISMASHELRAPLTAIKGYIDLLKDKKSLSADSESAHYIENIALSSDRLQSLVNDILEVSRVEGNSLPIEITTFDPYPIIAQSIEEMRSSAMGKNLALTYVSGETSAMTRADVNRLKQVLINLVSNSIKYTLKGSIDVTTSIKGKEFLITVADTGVGISAEDQTKLFQKFYRIQNENTRGVVGTGLGLWITLEITKRMKGKITVESIEGVGSHFTIHLPLA